MNGLPDLGYHFDWQEGHTAFSVSESQIAAVRKSIQTQEQHHAHRTSHEELVALLRKHRIEFNQEDSATEEKRQPSRRDKGGQPRVSTLGSDDLEPFLV
jgi:hypothetical protein